MGSVVWRSRATKSTPSSAAAASEPTIAGEVQPSRLPNVTATMRADHRRHEQHEAEPIEAYPARDVAATRDEQQAGHHPDQPGGHVDEEDEAPTAGGQQQAANGRPQGETERLGSALDADAAPERLPRDGHVDDGDAVGLQHRRTQRLKGAEGIQGAKAWRKATEDGAQDEDRETVGVEQFAPDHVGKATHRRDGGNKHQQIAQADPGHRNHVGVKDVLQRRQGHGDDARVQLPHEGAHTYGRHHKPGGVGVLGHPAGTAWLD